MKTAYSTQAKTGDNLKIVRHATTLNGAFKSFRRGKAIVTCTIRKS